MRAPEVSVVIPTFGRSERLVRALESAERQTHHPLEILVVNDNPPASPESALVSDLVRSVSRAREVQTAGGEGAGRARNRGVACAVGQYIMFLDDDDWAFPQRAAVQLGYFRDKAGQTPSLVFCHSESVADDGTPVRQYGAPTGDDLLWEHLHGCVAGTSLWMVDRETFLALGGFPDVPRNEDAVFLLRLLARGDSVACAAQTLVRCTEHADPRMSGLGHANLIGQLAYRSAARAVAVARYGGRVPRSVEACHGRRLAPLQAFHGEWVPTISSLAKVGVGSGVLELGRTGVHTFRAGVLGIRARAHR